MTACQFSSGITKYLSRVKWVSFNWLDNFHALPHVEFLDNSISIYVVCILIGLLLIVLYSDYLILFSFRWTLCMRHFHAIVSELEMPGDCRSTPGERVTCSTNMRSSFSPLISPCYWYGNQGHHDSQCHAWCISGLWPKNDLSSDDSLSISKWVISLELTSYSHICHPQKWFCCTICQMRLLCLHSASQWLNEQVFSLS